MSRFRIIAALSLATALAGLLVWQHYRSRQIAACLEDSGIWDGHACRADERRIRIQRELHRT